MLKTRLPLRPVSRAGQGQGSPGVSRGSLQLEGEVRPLQHQQLGGSEAEAATGDLGQQEAGAHCETASLPWGLGVPS